MHSWNFSLEHNFTKKAIFQEDSLLGKTAYQESNCCENKQIILIKKEKKAKHLKMFSLMTSTFGRLLFASILSILLWHN